jgi:hypothetical protein
LTLKEAGGTALRCRVVAAWTLPEGGKAFQVQDVASGEMITITEGGANKAKRIVHWGKHTTPPPGVPVPPAVETAGAEAPKVEAPKVEVPKVELPRVEPPKTEPAAAAPIIINGSSPAAKVESAALPVIINAPPPSDLTPPVICENPPPAHQMLGSRIAERVQSLFPGKSTPDEVVSVPPVVAPPEIKVPALVVETKQAPEWRESWGKTASAQEPPPPLVPPPSAGRPNPQTTPGFFPATEPRQAAQAQAAPPPFQPGQPLDGRVQRVPAGMQSVVAAADGQVQYMPVPIMTQPPVARMPQAPNPVGQQPGMPGMPPADQFVNAFTPPQQQSQPPMPMAGYGMYPQGMMPMGYGPPMYRAPYPPYAMVPQMANGPMVPMGYSGPMPAMPYAPAARPAMPMIPQATSGHVEQQVATLKNALYPSHREMAAMHLAGYNALYYPQVVRALATSAKDDPAPTVRVACVNGLAKMQANSPEVVGMLNQLRNDGDPRVRQEVDQALARLAPGLAPMSEPSNVQPAQATQMPMLP